MEKKAPLIELVDVKKTYGTGDGVAIEVLHGISLTIHEGEFVSIMGASGSGKSTLMNIIGCLDHPDNGQYRFAGKDVAELDQNQLAALRREAFGFIFQNYNLIATATATENVEIPAIYAGVPAQERRERAELLLGSLGLSDRLMHRPNQLSGGQQQRVSIARALMNGGQIILADEPTGALDSHTGAEVISLLHELSAKGHTILLITHDLNIARNANRLIELKDGMVVNDSMLEKEGAPVLSPAFNGAPLHDNDADSLTAELGASVNMAIRALFVNFFRTTLTLLGIMIGVAAMIAMLAIGEGAKKSVLERISSMGTNLLLIRPGAPNARGPGTDPTVTSLVPADADAISELPNVLTAVPEATGSITARFGNNDVQTQVTATTTDYTIARNWNVVEGAFFNREDEISYATVAILGQTVKKNLFGNRIDPVGKYVLLNNVPFLVVGVLEVKGATQWGSDADDVVVVPLPAGSLRILGYTFLRTITVAVKDVGGIDATQEDITALLNKRHGKEDFQVRNQAALLEMVSQTQNTLTLLLGSIAAISLLVGGIGVMNIMLVTVTERTREIGIRLATGARMRDILHQFLTEAMVMSAVGGSIGVMAGLATGKIISNFDMPVSFSVTPVLLAFSCAMITGLIFGFAPALKAARLDPVVALASE
jgi:macrolide transport system ATP-binding/permease protein